MMIEKAIIVTNNTKSRDELGEKYEVDFIEGNTMLVFEKVRDYIHKGHKLLTHPLMSSIKPNQTPFRTVVVSKEAKGVLDLQSLAYIEEGIHTTEKFLKNYGVPKWTDSILDDFQVIDYDLIKNAIS